MKSNAQLLFSAIFLLYLAGHLCFPVSIPASTASIKVNGDLISIIADQEPLIELLETLSSKTGVTLQTGEALSEKVSCNYTDLDMEQIVRNLLKKHNYALIYSKTPIGKITLKEIKILEDQPDSRTAHSGQVKKLPPKSLGNPDYTSKKFNRDWFKQNLQNKKQLLKQILILPVMPGDNGIQIESFPKDSFFSKIGFSKGDTVENINGVSIRSVNKLVDVLKFEHVNSFGIHCSDANGETKAIYIHLENAPPPDKQI